MSDGIFYDVFEIGSLLFVKSSLSCQRKVKMEGQLGRKATGHRHTVAQQLGARPDSGT